MATDNRTNTKSESNGISSAFFGVVAILFFLAALFKPMTPENLPSVCFYFGCGFSSLGASWNTKRLYEKVTFKTLFAKVPMPIIPAIFYMLSNVCFAIAAFFLLLEITP